MLLSLWSSKGGSGTSTVAATCALLLARRGGARLADLAGDQPSLLGLDAEPGTGLGDWLAAGAEAPVDALDRLAVEAAPDLVLLPLGEAPPATAAPEAGAALAVALRDHAVPTVADLGRADTPAAQAIAEVADLTVLVLRACYLGLRRALSSEVTALSSGVVLVEETGRALRPEDVADVLALPVLARVALRPAVARAVDAGVLARRLPDALSRPAERLLDRLGVTGTPAGEAA
jgi:hypothetical protein